MIPGKKYAPDELVAMVWARKWLVAVCVAIGGTVAFSYGRTLPKRFTSGTTVMLVPQRVADGYVDARTRGQRVEERLKSMPAQVKSRARLEQVVKEFDLYKDSKTCRSMDEIIECMRLDADVSIVGPDTFKISYTTSDPVLAMQVANGIKTRAIDELLREGQSAADKTRKFLEDSLDTARKNLEEQEKRLEDYRRLYSGELPEQAQANQQTLQGAQSQLQSLQDSLSKDRDRRLEINRKLSELLADAAAEPAPAAAAAAATTTAATTRSVFDELEKARENYKTLRSHYTEQHPDVMAAHKAVRDLQAQYDREQASRPTVDRTPAPAGPNARVAARQDWIRDARIELENTDRQISAKQTDERRVRGTIDEMRRRLDATPTRESELTKLTRDYNTVSTIYQNLLKNREDSKINEKLSADGGEQFRVLDPAKVPTGPSSPDQTRIVSTGCAIGFAFALLVVAFVEYRNLTLRDEDEVTACTGLPVIAVIPLMVQQAAGKPAPRIKRLFAGPASAGR